MTEIHRRFAHIGAGRVVAAGLVLAVVAGACGPSVPSAAPSITASLVPAITASPSVSTPIASPSAASTPIASPSAAGACPVVPQTGGQLPSDRIIDLQVAAGATADTLTFVFGPASLGGKVGAARGSLDAAQPPYAQAGSGAAVEVIGAHVIRVRFDGMSLQNDAGEEIYKGQAEIKPSFPALRDAVVFDSSEGVIAWYIGYDGTGCVTLARSGTRLTVTIAHG